MKKSCARIKLLNYHNSGFAKVVRLRIEKQMTALIEQEGNGFVSLSPELPIASQGVTLGEARDNLCEAAKLFFECVSANAIERREVLK